MAMKKFKICVGICGSRLLYTNIIKAENKRDAVVQYLSEFEGTPTEVEIQKYIGHTHEVVPTPKRKDDEPLTDAFGNPFTLGQKVAFVRNSAPSFEIGEVLKITNSSIVVKTSNGNETRVTCTKGSFSVEYAFIMNDRPKKSGSVQDATGYPVCAEDKVVFILADFGRKHLVKGTVKDIKNTRVIIEYINQKVVEQTYKTFNKIIVL